MKRLSFLVLLSLAGGVARADSSLTIDLPLVNGVPTLSGTPGEVVVVDATITADTPLYLGDANVTQPNGGPLGIDTSIYSDPGNSFYAAIVPTNTPLPANSVTTGALVTITFPDGPPTGMETLQVDVQYNNTSFFAPTFVVDSEAPAAPEPASVSLALFGLGLGFVWLRRKTVR